MCRPTREDPNLRKTDVSNDVSSAERDAIRHDDDSGARNGRWW